MNQQRSPFKFLDAYTAADKDLFFGRDNEIEALYNLVFKTPMVLVYGMSGTGKTSLIQCGLATRFDGPDWLPFHIRKGRDINQSLRKELGSALEGKKATALNQAVEDLFYTYFRPVYLIFDQFEELFILGSPEEQQQFMADIQALISAELPCKVLFVMREEYIGQLYDFEKELPGIFDHKLRVEPMNNKRVKEVMQQSFERFNITLGAAEEDLYQSMIDNISGGKSGIPLTYLQVYLDMLYVEDLERTYPDGTAQKLPALEFTKEEIDDFGKIDDVLDRYLKEQVAAIQEALEGKFPQSQANTVRTVLDTFVTLDGTKRPLGYQFEQGHYTLDRAIMEDLQVPQPVLSFCLNELEKARLLRKGADSIELGHDTLAHLIDEQRTGEQRQLNELKKRFLSDFKTFQQTGEYLSDKRITAYEDFLPLLSLSEAQQEFVQASRQYNQAQANAEKERQARELQLAQDKLAAEEKGRKRQNLFSALLGGALLIALGVGWWANEQRNEANTLLEVTESQKTEIENSLTQIQRSQAAKQKLEFEILKSRAAIILDAKGCPETILQEMTDIADSHPDSSAFRASIRLLNEKSKNCQ